MTAVRLAQLSLFGEIDDDLSWEWNKLHEMTDLEAADVRNKDAQTDEIYIAAGVIRADQVTTRLAKDPESPYAGIDDEAIEDIPDDDIGAITDKILEMGGEPEAAAPVPVSGAGLPAGAQGGLEHTGEPGAQAI